MTAVAEPTAPPFQLVRSDESYLYLRDPSNHRSWDDLIKYVPLNADGEVYLSLGGEIRERYDVFDAPRFGIGSKSDAYDLQRILLHADLHVGPHVRFYAELANHDVFDKRTAILPVDKDPTDVQNAFLDINSDAMDRWRLRVGRQELLLNATQRFISVREGPNIRQSYDGARVTWRNTDWNIDGFSLRPVLAKPRAFDDRGDPNTLFSGLYVSRRLSAWSGSVDGYWIALDRWNAKYGATVADERRRGIGSHITLKREGWDFDGDVLLQYGTFGTADIRAWGAGVDVGRTFDAPWHPRAGLRLDGASGGSLRDPTQLSTFNPLFPKGLYFDESMLSTYANLLSIRPSVTVTPIPTLNLQVSEAWRWRQSREDALYLIPFVPLPQTLDNQAKYVGQWTIVDALWRVNRYWTIQAEYVHVIAGDAVTLARGHDVNFEMLIARFQF
jgi:hypothetical protein